MKIKRVSAECWPRYDTLAASLTIEEYRALQNGSAVTLTQDAAAALIAPGHCIIIKDKDRGQRNGNLSR